MKNIVVYESKYGSTERYAKWIAKELHCKISRIKDINIDELANYDNIIFGGCIHEGKLKGFKKIRKNTNKLKDKNFFIFGVALAETEDSGYKKFKNKNFSKLNVVEEHYLRGAFNFNKATFIDKMMMIMFKMILKLRNSNNEYDEIISMIGSDVKPIDFTNKENIRPIVQAVRDLDN